MLTKYIWMAILDINKGLLGFLIRFLLELFLLAKDFFCGKDFLWEGFCCQKQ